jgi:hypothetical protein
VPHLRLRRRRPLATLAAVTAAVLIGAAPAAAAPPANETPETATDLTTFPFTEEISIAEAGTEPFDVKTLRRSCGSDAAEGTVWYRFEAPADGVFTFDVSTPDAFTPGVALVSALPASRSSLELCGEGSIIGEVQAGDVFWLAAFSRTPSPTGTMTVAAQFRPSRPIAVSLDSVVADRQSGTVTVNGTYACSLASVDYGWVDVQLNPRTGRDGYGSIEITECSGEPQPFSIEVSPSRGGLTGSVEVRVSAAACDAVGCDRDEQTVKVKPQG